MAVLGDTEGYYVEKSRDTREHEAAHATTPLCSTTFAVQYTQHYRRQLLKALHHNDANIYVASVAIKQPVYAATELLNPSGGC
jgi:hypothetical protein